MTGKRTRNLRSRARSTANYTHRLQSKNMVVPDIISSDSFDINDSMSVITMNEHEENFTVATYTPTVVNPNKRRRLMREPPLTEEEDDATVRLSPKGGWGTKNGNHASSEPPASPAMATATDASSFGVPLAEFGQGESTQGHSLEDLSIELCKIVTTKNYSRSESVKALGTFCQWGYSDDAVFLENFLELGGIQRVLIYLQNNKGDPQCVAMASKVIMACTFRNSKQKSFAFANDIVRALAKRNGIQVLLDACSEYRGENMVKQLDALRWIWAALMNITDKTSAYESSESALQKDQLLAVFESGLEAMAKLGKNVSPVGKPMDGALTKANDSTESTVINGGSIVPYNAVGGADYQLKAVQWIFTSLCGGGGSRKRAAMDMMVSHPKRKVTKVAKVAAPRPTGVMDNSTRASMVMGLVFSTWSNIVQNSKLDRDDFVGMDLLRKCISTLKSHESGAWIGNKDLLIQASRFFVQCHEKGIVSNGDDFEVVFPLLVECIGKYPEAAFKGGLFGFVKDAYSVVERSFLQGSGVVRAIATAWESDNVNKSTKTAAHQLLKELL